MKFDLHIHSQYSPDSKSPVDAIVARACEIGLDGIAVTDHDTIRGSLEAEAIARELDVNLIVIPGMELSTKKGHLLILGIREELPQGLLIDEAINMAREIGATIIAPHPFELFRNGIGALKGRDIDAIEVFNSKFIFGISNFVAKRYASVRQIGTTGGSDAHKVETIGYGYTVIDGKSGASAREILNAIREHKSRAEGSRTSHYFSSDLH